MVHKEFKIGRIVNHFPNDNDWSLISSEKLGALRENYDFKVRWNGYSKKHDLWLPYDAVKTCVPFKAYLRKKNFTRAFK